MSAVTDACSPSSPPRKHTARPLPLGGAASGAASFFGRDATRGPAAAVKRAILRMTLGTSVAQLATWGAIYWFYGEIGSALVASFWATGSLALWASATWRWLAVPTIATLGLLSILVGNLLFTLLLGGVLASCGQLIWVLLAPVGGIIFAGPRSGLLWLGASAALLVGALVMDPYAAPTHAIPPRVQALMLAGNIVAPMAFITLTLAFFRNHEVALLELIKAERRRSEALLLNILPAGVAARLREGEKVIADRHESVSILFADLANFTALSASMPPERLVALLDDVFSGLDRITMEHGAEKIKTIGDCYMAAAGLSYPRADHAGVLADVALAIRSFLEQSTAARGYGLQFRIGIGSGPVVAGVIGKDRFAYDLWGDTVNTASRMESHGVVGRIQITGETYEELRGRFDCEARGAIPVKGKGDIETWFLLGRK